MPFLCHKNPAMLLWSWLPAIEAACVALAADTWWLAALGVCGLRDRRCPGGQLNLPRCSRAALRVGDGRLRRIRLGPVWRWGQDGKWRMEEA